MMRVWGGMRERRWVVSVGDRWRVCDMMVFVDFGWVGLCVCACVRALVCSLDGSSR